MNFLAHAYLSFDAPHILVGNMIADLVKGKQIEQYPESIQKGIHIHRQIDEFTDRHPITSQAAQLLRSSAGKYAGAFIDVSYDHFLALDTSFEPKEGWSAFAEKSYNQIEMNGIYLPAQFCNMFMYMRSEDWFYNYRYDWMIERSFFRLKQRANYLDDDAPVFDDFKLYYSEIKESFRAFFPELELYTRSIS